MPRGIRARIFAAFAVLLAVLSAASISALQAHHSVHDELDAVSSAERGIEAALRLSAAVRDQYAHQAHTVILDDRSHLEAYAASRAAVEDAMAEVRRLVHGEDERALLAEIEALSTELDRLFVHEIVPRIPGGARSLAGPNGAGMALVERIVGLADRLTVQLKAGSAAAHQRAEAADVALVWRAGIFVVLGGLCAAGLGIYLDRSIAEPLQHLDAGARSLAAGDLTARVPENRDDELGSLARRFNLMAGELAQRQEQLVQSEKLAGVGRLAAGVAHEINNPLAVILGYSKLLTRVTDEGVAGDARVILQEAERCREIVEGLLNLTRPSRLLAVPIDLAQLLEEIDDRLPGDGGGTLEISGSASVVGDPGKLRQILGNLLRNARDAAPGEPVVARIEASDERVRIRISDRGAGVAPDARSRLFEPFFTTKASGTGLGLAVSASLAAAHGGSIELIEDGPGATFEVSLPQAVRVAREAG